MSFAVDCQLVKGTQSGGGGGLNEHDDEDFAWVSDPPTGSHNMSAQKTKSAARNQALDESLELKV